MREDLSATDCSIRACSAAVSSLLGGCISHDAIGPQLARRAPGVIKVMQVGYRLAHREESLVQVEPALREQRAEQVARALRLSAQHGGKKLELLAVVSLQLGDTHVRAAERLAVRRKD